MSTTTYVIRNAGQYESALKSTGSPIRATEYDRVRDAARDVARVACIDADALSIAGPCGEADWYAREPSASASRSSSVAYTLAIIVSKADRSGKAELVSEGETVVVLW